MFSTESISDKKHRQDSATRPELCCSSHIIYNKESQSSNVSLKKLVDGNDDTIDTLVFP